MPMILPSSTLLQSLNPTNVVGQLIVTSHDKVFGYVTFDGKQVRSAGTFKEKAPLSTLTLKGVDATAEKVAIKLFK